MLMPLPALCFLIVVRLGRLRLVPAAELPEAWRE